MHSIPTEFVHTGQMFILRLLCHILRLKGVIKSEPDAWIWLGDFVYMDSAFLSCKEGQNSSQCFDCTPTILAYPPDNCNTGDLHHALAKIHMQVWTVLI